MVLVLEGGYDVDALADSVHACTRVLAGAAAPPLHADGRRVAGVIGAMKRVHRTTWRSLSA